MRLYLSSENLNQSDLFIERTTSLMKMPKSTGANVEHCGTIDSNI